MLLKKGKESNPVLLASGIATLTTEPPVQGEPCARPPGLHRRRSGCCGRRPTLGTLPWHLTQPRAPTPAPSSGVCTRQWGPSLHKPQGTSEKSESCQAADTGRVSGELLHRHSTASAASPGAAPLHVRPSALGLTRYAPGQARSAEAQCHAAAAKLPPVLGSKTHKSHLQVAFSYTAMRLPFGPGLQNAAGASSNSQRAAKFANIIIPNAHCLSVSLLTPTSEHSVARSFTSA